MAEQTAVSYATHTWSPWIGCSKVASGCTHCYAEADFDKRRKRVKWGPDGTRSKTSDAYWKKPERWNQQQHDSQAWHSAYDSVDAEPVRIFPSICDVFEKWDGPILDHKGKALRRDRWNYLTMDDLRRDMFDLIRKTDELTWLLLTKRPENIRKMLTLWAMDRSGAGMESMDNAWESLLPLDNVWLIFSASDQESLDAGLPHLIECDELASVLGLSLEPLLGPVVISLDHISWVVIGGESGPNARPCEIEWIADIVRQCREAGVPCYVKQDSGPKPGQQGRIPDDLWNVKEFPDG